MKLKPTLSLAIPQAVKVIYVSTDTDPKVYAGTIASFPWYRMTFFDDSDFAPLAYSAPEAVEVSRGENFVQAGVSSQEGCAADV